MFDSVPGRRTLCWMAGGLLLLLIGLLVLGLELPGVLLLLLLGCDGTPLLASRCSTGAATTTRRRRLWLFLRGTAGGR